MLLVSFLKFDTTAAQGMQPHASVAVPAYGPGLALLVNQGTLAQPDLGQQLLVAAIDSFEFDAAVY